MINRTGDKKIMLTVEKLSRRPETFRRLTGMEVSHFYEIAEQIRPLWEERRDNFEEGGREHSLHGHENHLLAMLLYYRCYITYEFLSFFFDCHETTVIRSVKRIEEIAVQVVHIEKKREITREDAEYLIIDATEQPVQRPKKGQKKYYSGKKKRHTVKTQYVIGPDGKICSVSRTYPGKTHDFSIYKDQKNRDRFHGVPKKADSGYQGISRYDAAAEIPFKKPKNGELTDEQRIHNHKLSKKRIKVENVIREMKIFKILSDTYRNRRRGLGIKTNIIAGIVNMKTEKRNMKKAA
jgi:hypothetical protein